MAKHVKPIKAYDNREFLRSPHARTIRILAEIHEPQARFKELNVVDTIVFFGSARIKSKKEATGIYNKFKREGKKDRNYKSELKHLEKQLEMSKYYEDTVELSKRLTHWSKDLPTDEKRFIVCSGGGPGIMEAANKGAYLAGGPSVGLNISIPFEQFVNKYVKPELAFEFHYFFTRKLWFMYMAKALIIFPGGFGTMDEMMEMITLIQTGKTTKKMIIVVYDEKYWKSVINFDALIESGTISEKDMKIMTFCNTVDEAFTKITNHFNKYYIKNGIKKK